jgi:pimeloyl-ACP methyl ester carboxylesterase
MQLRNATMPLETAKDSVVRFLSSYQQGGWREAVHRGIENARYFIRVAVILADDFSLRVWPRRHRPRWLPRAMIAIAGAALCLYLGLAAVIYFTQRSLMYFPDTAHVTPEQAGLSHVEEVPLTTADGAHITVWHAAPVEGKPVILYFHGNGGALHYRVARFQKLIEDGIGLVALEYRGYGGNSGSPSEAGLIADAEAAYGFAAARYSTSQIVVWGESLGTGVAVALASEKPVGRVILEAPFTSAAAVAKKQYWFMPERLVGVPDLAADAGKAGFRRLVFVVDIERLGIGAGGLVLVAEPLIGKPAAGPGLANSADRAAPPGRDRPPPPCCRRSPDSSAPRAT